MSKTWLITGTSSGLGRELTEQLLQRGDTVLATVRNVDALNDLAAQYAERLHVLALDLTDTRAIRHTVASAFAQAVRIDVVVSNAAYGLLGAGEALSDAQIERQIATNLTGSIQLIRAVLPHLRQQGGGRIVQISSEGGQIAYPAFSLYHATKWGIEGFIEAVAQEVAAFGIDFVIAEPGPTATRFGNNLDQAEPIAAYAGTPADVVANMISARQFPIKGDAQRTVAAIIAATDAAKPALRLPLGSSAYDNITRELAKRLAALQALRDVAYSADADASA
ncbi:SDR family oxidoreductase [Amantichitinum ursilacus]|uniref:NADP-dependent 3-hydroxy acid dehydrogenase YdfG n=1 Tax=Amantichitinum ursilacus TaxID=857265 RepID=A0A0N0GQ75_9NEIS|nr:SDR family oxidoreductase [Amantichitinum ursilacus]KPC54430.1 NADP-dependent 3-hydroxy acid dehydrogenase YdfG [Amantichitinum ursilacus]